MTEKVVEFRKRGTWYNKLHGGLQMCSQRVRTWLDVPDRFWMHVSTKKPSHDEYYVVKCISEHRWEFADGQDENRSPWPSEIDRWFNRNFGVKPGVRLYVWAVAWEDD